MNETYSIEQDSLIEDDVMVDDERGAVMGFVRFMDREEALSRYPDARMTTFDMLKTKDYCLEATERSLRMKPGEVEVCTDVRRSYRRRKVSFLATVKKVDKDDQAIMKDAAAYAVGIDGDEVQKVTILSVRDCTEHSQEDQVVVKGVMRLKDLDEDTVLVYGG